ncbi:MAG: hypothetical protein Kow0056_00380 [Coriobacteriia bacterium]
MTDEGVNDYFVVDTDEDIDEDLLGPPVIVPPRTAQTGASQTGPSGAGGEEAAPPPPSAAPQAENAAGGSGQATVTAAEEEVPASQVARPSTVPVEGGPRAASVASPASARSARGAGTREERLAAALDGLMEANADIQATALVSLDGFTMASALPAGMQEDRVGAMSAAILGLGERAAAELGRGGLEQVYIEGSDGIVVLVSAGGKAVLTALASRDARLGLVIYDMKAAAEQVAEILG